MFIQTFFQIIDYLYMITRFIDTSIETAIERYMRYLLNLNLSLYGEQGTLRLHTFS